MLRRLYDRLMALAADRRAPAWLAVVAFAESSVFPAPPDLMLAPMVLARPDHAWRNAGICSLASVAGGVLGYAIGYFLAPLGQGLLDMLGQHGALASFQAWYGRWGLWVILIKGLTPIPYKLVTIASGLASVPFPLFMLYSTIVRFSRFCVLEGVLVHFFGAQAKAILDKYLEVALVVFLIAVVLGFVALRYL